MEATKVQGRSHPTPLFGTVGQRFKEGIVFCKQPCRPGKAGHMPRTHRLQCLVDHPEHAALRPWIGGVFPPHQTALLGVGQQGGFSLEEERTAQASMEGPHGRQAACTRAPREALKDGLCLVICVVAQGDTVCLGARPAGVPCSACARHQVGTLGKVEGGTCERQVVSRCRRPGGLDVESRLRSQAVVQALDREVRPVSAGGAAQDVEQDDAVEAS